MSEELQDDYVDDIVDEDITIDEPEDKPKKKDEPEIKGYMSKEAWIASGKNPDDWRDPVEFKVRGVEIKLRKEFEERLKHNNFLHQQRLETELRKAKAERREAISIADHAAVDALDNEIDAIRLQQEEIKRSEVPVVQDKDPLVADWEASNPWIFNADDPKARYANAVCSDALGKGKTMAEALLLVDELVERKFGAPKKQTAPMVEGSRTAGGKPSAGSGMSWSDLSEQDKNIFNQVWPKSGDINKDKRAFLKALQDEKKV